MQVNDKNETIKLATTAVDVAINAVEQYLLVEEQILDIKVNYGLEDDNQTLKIYMSREDLANLSNMTTSNAIRTLSGFVNEKLIVVDGRRIKITNEYQLRQIARFG